MMMLDHYLAAFAASTLGVANVEVAAKPNVKRRARESFMFVVVVCST